MSAKLLFITSHYFHQPTVDALSRLALPWETLVVPYDNFEHIAAVYGRHAEQFDVCFVSGMVAKQAIEMAYPHPPRPLVYFQVSANGLHRDILRLAVETGNTDFGRIAMDFLLALGDNYSVTDFLKIQQLDEVYSENSSKTRLIGTGNGYTIEDMVLKKITTLWERGAIDLVICQYSSLIPHLQKRGIPFHCPFLSDQHLGRIIHETMTWIELQQLRENHPVIVQIFPRSCSVLTEARQQALGCAVQAFAKNNLLDCVIQTTEASCVIISSLQVLRTLTQDFRSCLLGGYLEHTLDFPVLIGYGVGTTVPHAMNNAQLASREAKLTGKSFIVDGKGSLIGPLDSEHRMVVSSRSLSDVSEIARSCSLSVLTIQKLITILANMGSDKLTTPELALRLNTTIRNANRIMQNLCRGGVASPVYTQPTHSRGRPIQVYRLDFGSVTG